MITSSHPAVSVSVNPSIYSLQCVPKLGLNYLSERLLRFSAVGRIKWCLTYVELVSETALMGSTASISSQFIHSESSARGDEGEHKWFIRDYPQLNGVVCIFNTAFSFSGEWGGW